MKPLITVVSFLWGTWFGLKKKYLEILERGIRRQTTFPLRFVCISPDEQGPIGSWEFLPLVSPCRKQNLKKLALYYPQNNLSGRIFVVDLDVLVVGSLDDIFSFEGPFCIKANHKPLLRGEYIPGGDMFVHNKTNWKEAWKFINSHKAEIIQKTRGRERWFYQKFADRFWEVSYLQKEYPGQVLSFKRDNIAKTREIPDNARLISFHGRNAKPHNHDWVRENYWK